MKIRPSSPSGGVVVELGATESKLPGTSTAGLESTPAFNLKRILVPIDFSECSRKALRYAVPFARQFDAQIGLLFVGQSYYFVPELVPLDHSQIEPHRELAKKLADLAHEEIGDFARVDVLIRHGHPASEIANVAQDWNADLIVISTHGYTGLKHAWFGSTSENLVRHATCPVLVVRPQEHEFLSCTENPQQPPHG
jgi:universal stress protein A